MKGIRLANAPCSWGTLEFDGIEGDEIPFGQMLDELVETGYSGTELGDWGYMPTSSDELAAQLTQRSLSMRGAFVPIDFSRADAHGPGQLTAIKTARLISEVADPGSPPFLVLADDNGSDSVRTGHAGRISASQGLASDTWQTFAQGVNQVARAVHDETGLRSVFHHHCAGFVESPDEIEKLLALTDPDLVGLVFDTGHFLFGSGNQATVQEGLSRYQDRIWYLHFKDFSSRVFADVCEQNGDYFTAVAAGVFCELGKGAVRFEDALTWITDTGYEGWICVEQDVLPGMGNPRESAKRNRDFLASLGL